MTAQTEQSAPFTQEELSSAQNSEQIALMTAQIEHLSQRCVSLRANLDRALAENKRLQNMAAPQDRRPAKKAEAKKAERRLAAAE